MVITSDIAVSGIIILNSRYSLHLELRKRQLALPELRVALAFCLLKERVLAGMLGVCCICSQGIYLFIILKGQQANQTEGY